MDINFTPEQRAWRQEVIDFLEQEITPEFIYEVESEDTATSYGSPAFSTKLAERGWLNLYRPKEYGGGGRPFMDQAILNEQCGYYRAPLAAHHIGVDWVGIP